MSIWKFLGLDKPEPERQEETPSAETETVRKIVEQLDRMEPERARYIAAFAYNLSRVAHADRHISAEETRAMERIVMEMGGLPEEQALLVVQMAKTQSRLFGGTENFLVTREFNKLATREQKLRLLECLFAVSASDQSISTAEDNEIRQISKELLLSHKDFIQARLAFREHLAVLKKPPKE
ncbi:TerB family tellurite resistance protein [Acidobacteriia bacterium AH_259_A11_L15]|nr:TerB family tellurite resistance protein [Acidobacteriia bacterium AH_259_A11_L15]